MAKSMGQIHADFLRGVIANGGRIERANFVATAYNLTLVQSGVRSMSELEWTPELEKFLLFEQRQRMESEDEEAARFATILLHNLESAEERWNDEHVVHRILLEILRDRAEYDLQSLLARIPGQPWDLGTAHPDIADFLRNSIDGLQNTAVTALGYAPPQAIAIMAAALRIVLEDTFLLVP